MKRITGYIFGDVAVYNSDGYLIEPDYDLIENGDEIKNCLEKLAEYEETGLEPEEIKNIISVIMSKKEPRILTAREMQTEARKNTSDNIYYLVRYNSIVPIKKLRIIGDQLKYQRFGDVGEKKLNMYGITWVISTGRLSNEQIASLKLKHQ